MLQKNNIINEVKKVLDLFIDYDGDIDDIAEKISELLEIKLTKKIDEFNEKYNFYFMDIEFLLYGNHELEDDCDIPFSEYQYQMQLIKLRVGEKYKSYDRMYNNIAEFLMEKISDEFNANVMLVDNLQTIVSSSVPVK